MSAHQAPYHFDSAIWKMQTDAAVLVALALHEREHAMAACGWVVRGQMALFYLASGFWKINTAFLEHRTSCAPILFLSLLEYVPAALTPLVLTRFLTLIAPWTTIIGEMAIGALVLGNQTMQCIGVALAVLLHFMIAITPFPNQIPTFGVYCLVRLYFVLPESWSAAQAELAALPVRVGSDVTTTVKVAGMVSGLAVAAQLNSNPAFAVNWAIVLYFAMVYIALYALYLEATAPTDTVQHNPARDIPPNATSKSFRLAGGLLLALAVFYSFGCQVLGLMEMGLANPFASLRMHGGSNHLLMPTGLLQQAASPGAELGGGVVRVESCTSDFINALYPGESTANLSPRLRAMLTESGHIGRQFAPSVRIALGAAIRKYMPPNGDPFVPFTTTAYELRRILAHARGNNESFEIQYTRLAESLGDETWRANGTGVTFLYEAKPGWSRCHRITATRVANVGDRSADTHLKALCTEEELALQERPPPGGVLGRVLVNFGYAIIPELEHIGELPCYD